MESFILWHKKLIAAVMHWIGKFLLDDLLVLKTSNSNTTFSAVKLLMAVHFKNYIKFLSV